MQKHKTTEQQISERMETDNKLWAEKLNVDKGYLWQRRFFCAHNWINKGLYDDCELCGEGRA
jgi:hypothetical protein